MTRIGVLALQGSVIEHMHKLQSLPDVEAVPVKTREDLHSIGGIILPGGESTAIGKLLKDFDLLDPLQRRIEDGMPAWGTCAGMIMLAREIAGEAPYLSVMDIRVRRNAYGRQIDSFGRQAVIPDICAYPMELIFIRAPWIEAVKDDVRVLCTLEGHIVAARQHHMLATSFHPELTQDESVHRYFAAMVNGAA